MKAIALKSIPKWGEYLVGISMFGAMISMSFAYAKHAVEQSRTVVDSTMAGNLVDVSFISNMVDSDKSKINTDMGSFLVWGLVQEIKGTSFRLETRKDEERYQISIN